MPTPNPPKKIEKKLQVNLPLNRIVFLSVEKSPENVKIIMNEIGIEIPKNIDAKISSLSITPEKRIMDEMNKIPAATVHLRPKLSKKTPIIKNELIKKKMNNGVITLNPDSIGKEFPSEIANANKAII
jgi:hypothetical protein